MLPTKLNYIEDSLRPKTTFEELVTEMVLFDYNNEKNMIS